MVLTTEASLKQDSTKEDAVASLEEVVRECIKEGILTDYLTRKGTEVINMFLNEYDYDTDIAVQREEAMEEGIEKGLEQGFEQGAQQQAIETAINMLKNPKYSVDEISGLTSLPVEKVLELQSQLSNTNS